MTEQEMLQLALDAGFANAAIVNAVDIMIDYSFRPYRVENLCRQYGANYSCPPDCGSPEEMKQRLMAYKRSCYSKQSGK